MRIGYLRTARSQDLECERETLSQINLCHWIVHDKDERSYKQLERALSQMTCGDTLVMSSLSSSRLKASQLLSLLEQLDHQGAILEIIDEDISSGEELGQVKLLRLMVERWRAEHRLRHSPSNYPRRVRGRRPKLNPKAVQDMTRYLLEGLPSSDIAYRMGVSIATFYRYKRDIEAAHPAMGRREEMQDAGASYYISSDCPRRESGRRPKLNTKAVQDLLKQIQEGVVSKDIAQQLGISVATFYRYKRAIKAIEPALCQQGEIQDADKVNGDISI
ncbi:DNA invertase Pin-like site-specific DNA recombinase [Silvimonas terrae]|uniref:DNA invertase Pin-like site-specific DNA recombinase n=1 Tax=Silvimonas terrae TaxID=300266 RepID=A0A840RAF6_9NEIS|nr:helix-turn-helix domain-containing protein [Silvimonas terrae]MBB5189584.1 DNA invertase Pin-like site-specific DNA recombinase [Silvimonas terrae]